jgi:acylphosphatase
VYFRKHTEEHARELGLRGWVMNTANGTVVGELEGSTEKVQEMKEWLTHTGSPKSVIERAVFKNERTVDKNSFNSFDIRK